MTEYESCAYTHDISDEDRDVAIFGHMDADEWSCQHPAEDDTEYCPFHQPVEEKDDQAVVERFQKTVNTGYDDVDLSPQGRLQFIGAEFGDFSLPLFTTLAVSNETNPAASGYPIDLRDSRIEGTLNWPQTTVYHDLLFNGVFVGGDVNFSASTIQGSVSFVSGRFASLVRFDDVEVSGTLSFDSTEFKLAITMAASAVDHDVSFENSHVHAPEVGDERLESEPFSPGDIWSPDCQIGNNLMTRRAVIEQHIRLEGSEIGGRVKAEGADIRYVNFENVDIGKATSLKNAKIMKSADFDEANIGGAAYFSGAYLGSVDLNEADIEKGLHFNEAEIRSNAWFKEANIGMSAKFEGVNFGRLAVFSGANIEWSAEFSGSDINKDVKFDRANIGVSANFVDANIGMSADFEMADIGKSAVFRGADIGEWTDFTGANIEESVSFRGASIRGWVSFESADIGESVYFSEADIEIADFEEVDIGEWAFFWETNIREKAYFIEANIGESAEFKDAEIETAVFEQADIGKGVKFENVTTGTVSLQDANISSDTILSGNFSENPLMAGMSVEGTLRFDIINESDRPGVVNLTGATVRSLELTNDAHLLILDLTDASIGQFETNNLPTSDVLHRWSLTQMDFAQFDFTESRDVLTSIDWGFHTLEEEAREVLARDAGRERATDLVEVFTDLLIGVPALSRRIVDADTSVRDPESLVADAADIVFTDETIVSHIVNGDLDDTDVTEGSTVRDSINTDDEWTYTEDAARAIRDLRKTVETDPEFVKALAGDTVASQLKAIAAAVAEADPDVGPKVDDAPREQVDTDSLPTEELQAALTEAYADPEEFRAENNPEIWEKTYLDAKNAASDQGLNEMAAEFFLREKRFKRKRQAQRVKSSGSLFERTKAAFDWASNLTMDVTTGYGERPRNVIVSSVGIIGAFSGVYYLLGALPDGSGLSEYLLFSLQNFVTFIIGTQPQGTLPVRYLSAIQAFLGAFFVALFVFTLTRSLNR